MKSLLVLLALVAPLSQTPTPGRTATAHAGAQRPTANERVLRALEVLDSLIPVRAPRSLTAAQVRTWSEQTDWLKRLRDRMKNLLAMVVAPAEKVAVPAPISPRNIQALQKEAQEESLRFQLTSAALKARHDIAMNAIRNMK